MERDWHVMGILNVTPDSFSDGGAYDAVDAAVARVGALIAEGADSIDVGGESSRPGAVPVAEAEELRRVMPVVRAVRARWPTVPLSVDTTKAAVAAEAIAAGAAIINDISAGTQDAEMLPLLARHPVRYVVMHLRGTPATMQAAPQYGDVVAEVRAYLVQRVAACETAGIERRRLMVDPGFGFGKTFGHNMALLRGLSAFAALDVPLLVGVSRKSMIGQLLDGAPVGERLEGGLALTAVAYSYGARIFRTHDVAATRRFLQVWTAAACPTM